MSTLRDELLPAMHGGHPSRVVWGEMGIDAPLKEALASDVPAGLTFEEHFGLANYVCGGVCPPGIAEFGVTDDGKRRIKSGLRRTWTDYVLSSGNSLTSYVAPTNLRVTSRCVTSD